ncbi:hypothetical protein RSAG8_13524, partial [Rhizoctonia solani AG-8 WAC10335]
MIGNLFERREAPDHHARLSTIQSGSSVLSKGFHDYISSHLHPRATTPCSETELAKLRPTE